MDNEELKVVVNEMIDSAIKHSGIPSKYLFGEMTRENVVQAVVDTCGKEEER